MFLNLFKDAPVEENILTDCKSDSTQETRAVGLEKGGLREMIIVYYHVYGSSEESQIA